MRRFLTVFLGIVLCLQTSYRMPCLVSLANEETQTTGNIQDDSGEKEENTEELGISAESGIIMEASSGKVLYEKEADKELPPASVTKIMTLLLIFDALESGQIHLEDEVTTSEYAASMGGSQVFLEPGEKQSVETMIKCISVASANDACVAMSELICGSEQAFVQKMNERAKGLGMEHTHFVNCNHAANRLSKITMPPTIPIN